MDDYETFLDFVEQGKKREREDRAPKHGPSQESADQK